SGPLRRRGRAPGRRRRGREPPLPRAPHARPRRGPGLPAAVRGGAGGLPGYTVPRRTVRTRPQPAPRLRRTGRAPPVRDGGDLGPADPGPPADLGPRVPRGSGYPSGVDPKTRNRIMTGALALMLVVVAVV